MYLNFFEKPKKRKILIIGEKGKINCDLNKGYIKVFKSNKSFFFFLVKVLKKTILRFFFFIVSKSFVLFGLLFSKKRSRQKVNKIKQKEREPLSLTRIKT